MMHLKSFTLLLGALLSGALAAPASPRGVSPQVVPNKYIVTLRNNLVQPQVDSHLSWVENVHRRSLSRRDSEASGGVDKVWSASFKGYSGEFDAATIQEIQASEEVCFAGATPETSNIEDPPTHGRVVLTKLFD